MAVNSWRTLGDLSSLLAKQKLGSNECGRAVDIDTMMQSDEVLDLEYESEWGGKKLVGILKTSETTDSVNMMKAEQGIEFGLSYKHGLELDDLDDDLDEGLGDLDAVFDDFEEVYEATMREGYGVDLMESCDRKSRCCSETDSSGVSECDIESPMSDISIDSPFKFKSHCDSVSLYSATSVTDEPRECLCGLQGNKFTCSWCNKTHVNDNKSVRRAWMTDFSSDISYPSVPLLSQGCLKQSSVNNHDDNNTISPTSKTKSVHFAIFPYVIEIPRVSDLEMEFDRSAIINKHEIHDESTTDGNY